MSEPLEIRPATLDDAETILNLLHTAFEEYRGKIDPPSGAHSERLETVQKLLVEERGLLALLNGQAAGCLFFAKLEDSLYLHRLAVLPTFRGQGIGNALIAEVERAAHELRKVSVTLNVRISLPQNRSYYEKLGYRITGFDFHSGYNQFTFVNMAKFLEEPNLRKVEMVPHNPDWKNQFEVEAEQLRRVFGNQLVTIHHIGSTSIPGIYAKPIIDMLPIVQNIQRMAAFDPTMLALGYESLGEFGLPGRRYYRKGGHDHRSHHVHVYEAHNPEVDRHLAFRDYLIAYPTDAKHYSQLKRELAHQHPHDIYAYMDGKNGWIKAIEAKALSWWRSRDSN